MAFPISTAAGPFVAPSFAQIDLTGHGAQGDPAELALSGENGRWYAAGVKVASTAAAPVDAPVRPTASGTAPAVRLHMPAVLAPQDELTLSAGAGAAVDAAVDAAANDVDGVDGIGVDQAPPADALRQARLDQIQAAIADGTYDTDERMDAAIDRLLGSIG